MAIQPLPDQIINAVEQACDCLNPALAGWVREQLAKGYTPHALVMRMVECGRPVEIATLLVGLAIKGLTLAPANHVAAATPAAAGGDRTHAMTHAKDCGGQHVRKLLSIGDGGLELVLYDGLITDQEIEYLKAAAAPALARSPVLAANFGSAESEVRTSHGTFLDTTIHPALAALEQRVSAVTGIPADRAEAWQILRYRQAGEYRPHFDFFDPANQQELAKIAQAGNRVGTMIFYLSDVDEGGSTYFPKLDLAVHPHRGQAVWFKYLRDGMLDERSQHAGMPIISGEKWVATKWLRERTFRA